MTARATSPYLNRSPRTLAEVLAGKPMDSQTNWPSPNANRVWRGDDTPGFVWAELWTDGRTLWLHAQRHLRPDEPNDTDPFLHAYIHAP